MLRMIWVMVSAAWIASFAAKAEGPDFSGKWTADLANCDFGMESVPSSLVYNVEQKGLTLRVERMKQDKGKVTKDARAFQGKWDGPALLVEYHATYQGYDLEISEKWSLSNDRKTMTVLRSVSAGGGGAEQKLVFHKEPLR